jgi:hypothetical protein
VKPDCEPAEQPAPEECPARLCVANDPEQRDERDKGEEPERERREREPSEPEGCCGQNQGFSDVSGTSLRVDWDW